MAGEVKTQGTHLYLVDRTGGAAALVKMVAPTGITGVTSGAADQIDSTDLDQTTDRTFVKGLTSPAAISVPFILKPAEASHQLLFELKELGEPVDFAVLLSDGTAAPTLTGVDPNKVITIPATRSGFKFQANITEVTIDMATNEVVRGTLTLQRTGAATPYWKA